MIIQFNKGYKNINEMKSLGNEWSQGPVLKIKTLKANKEDYNQCNLLFYVNFSST